jgi:AGCS family alanine or glycine:cation symporter
MNLLEFLDLLNNKYFAYPSIILFFGVSLFLSIKTRFIQIRKFPYFIKLIFGGLKRTGLSENTENINAFHALLTAMGTTIGMGNMVGPTIAIMLGGPGALFWLLLYMFFGSVTKYVEVTYALVTREYLPDGFIAGGPMQYLKSISGFLASWYNYVIIFVLMGWSSGQSNTLANIMYIEGVPHWVIGLLLGLFVLVALQGGAKRVGDIASKMVPLMFVLYVSFSFLILFSNPLALLTAFKQVFQNIFQPTAAVGGFFGVSILRTIREGMFRGIYICEAGLGTSSIPHALADTKNPTDQGILAMGSMLADALLSLISGLLVLVTGIWSLGVFRSTMIYEVFRINVPGFGQYVLLATVTLFVLTTVMGNSFNGFQSFGMLVKDNRWMMRIYTIATALMIFMGSLMEMRLIWAIMDTLIVLVAIPNLIGLVLLVQRRPNDIKA